MNRFSLAPILAVLVLTLASVEATASSCTGSNAVAPADAACLEASFSNAAYDGNGTRYSYRKTCTYAGTIGIRIDMESGDDVFVSTSSSSWTTVGVEGRQTNAIYCCLDREGGFCNGLSDLLTDSYCSAEFGRSPALTSLSSSCTSTSATADVGDEECDLSASCSIDNRSISSSLSIAWTRVRNDVYACEGVLNDGTCPPRSGFGE